MLIVDSQVHIWAANTPERPWPPVQPGQPEAHKPEPITRDILLHEMAVAGVDRAVLVSPVFEGVRNDVVIAAAQAYPDRFAVMARIDPEAPASREMIPTLLRQPGLLGLRFTFHRPMQRRLLTTGQIDWLWPQAEQEDLSIMLLVRHSDLHIVDRIAGRHPGLKLVIDHLGLTEGKNEEAFREFGKLLPLAKRANVGVKASCLPLFTTDAYPYRWLHPYLRQVYDTFGPKRIFWGSDLSRLPCSYRQSVTMFTEEMAWLHGDDLEWIMGRGLCQWIGWETS